MKSLSLMCCVFALAGVTALAGCASAPWSAADMEPGTPRDVVINRLGPPTRVVALPASGQQRLQYSLQPFGQQAVMIDLDASGKVVRSRQVLTATEFNRIQAGQWTRADVEREFGPPALVDRVVSWDGPIMTYRWSDGSDMFYWVYLDPGGVVQRAHPGMELKNAPDRD